MIRRRAALVLGLALTLGAVVLGAGAVGAGALQDAPQEAQPSNDPIGDLLKNGPPAQPSPQTPPDAPGAPPTVPPAAPPSGGPAVTVQPTAPVEVAQAEPEVPAEEDAEPEPEAAPRQPTEPATPARRQRRPVAVVQAIDKITAETMQFEVEVGGRPVRFNRNLIFTARACEVSAPDEAVEDSVAYLEVSLQPRAQGGEPRQIFRGWMFASTPGVSGLQHPVYDAWVVGCKAA